MSPEALYLLATSAFWLGVALALRGLLLAARMPGVRGTAEAPRVLRALAVSFGLAVPLLLAPSVLPAELRPMRGDAFAIPLAWVVAPFWAWCAAAGIVGAGVRWVQGLGALRADERRARLLASLWWLAFGALGYAFLRRSGDPVEVLRGRIELGAGEALGIGAALVAAWLAMLAAGRSARRIVRIQKFTAHLTLGAGAIVFGVPFAWLLVSSLKEDKDMSSASGIVWVPKVQDVVPYMDPDNPDLIARYRGRQVVAKRVGEEGDGRLLLEVLRPLGTRGMTFTAREQDVRPVPREAPIVAGEFEGVAFRGMVVEELIDSSRRVKFLAPERLRDREAVFSPNDLEPVRSVGLRWRNYSDALEYLPAETNMGLVYLRNTLLLVVLSVIGTVLSSAVVAYAFARMRFPGKDALFKVLLSTMMLPGAVTLLPTFLIFRSLGWVDTLLPLWVPAFFASAFNVFMLRQFFLQVPAELEDAAKIDGCSYLKSFWSVMLPQVKPALAVIAIWTFMGAWNNFMGPLIYVSSPENMPIAYALQLFLSDRGGEPGLLMAAATMAMLPVVALFFFAQRYFIEGATLSGLGGR